MKRWIKENLSTCVLIGVPTVITIVGILGYLLLSNRQLIDSSWKFDRAQIRMFDGTTVEGKLDKWLDYKNSDAVQICIDGITYYTHASNIILISK